MTARTWTDQPAVCEQAAVLWSLHVPDVGIVEIRGMPAPEDPKLHNREYLVSVGNLLDSRLCAAMARTSSSSFSVRPVSRGRTA